MSQLIRFGLVGAGTNAAAYLVYLLITYSGVEPKSAMRFWCMSLAHPLGSLATGNGR